MIVNNRRVIKNLENQARIQTFGQNFPSSLSPVIVPSIDVSDVPEITYAANASLVGGGSATAAIFTASSTFRTRIIKIQFSTASGALADYTIAGVKVTPYQQSTATFAAAQTHILGVLGMTSQELDFSATPFELAKGSEVQLFTDSTTGTMSVTAVVHYQEYEEN